MKSYSTCTPKCSSEFLKMLKGLFDIQATLELRLLQCAGGQLAMVHSAVD